MVAQPSVPTAYGRKISPGDYVKELESQGMALSEAQAYVENIMKSQTPKEKDPGDYPDYGLRRDGTLFIRPSDIVPMVEDLKRKE